MMRFWKNTDGSSLVEVMAAAVVLSVLLLIAAQGFSMSSRVMERGRNLKQEIKRSILSAETDGEPDEAEPGELFFDSPAGVEYRIAVTIKRYGNILILSSGEDQKDQLWAGMRGNDEPKDGR